MAWQDIAKNVAPVLAGVLPPPFNVLAGVAVKAALGLDAKATEKQLEQAMVNATPEQLLALKTAENAFLLDMEKLGVDLEKIAAGDRDSARKREVDTKDKTPIILALLITMGFFGILAYMLMYGLNKDASDALLIMLGSLGTAWGSVVAYYFGSTSGSARKTEMLGKK